MSKTYDPSEVSVIVGGSIIKFDLVAISYNESRNFMTSGTQGEVTRTKNNSKLGTVTLTLPQSSDDNTTLSAKAVVNGVEAISVIDKGGTSLAVMPEGVITEMPESEFGKEHGQRVWEFQGDLPVYVVGGN